MRRSGRKWAARGCAELCAALVMLISPWSAAPAQPGRPASTAGTQPPPEARTLASYHWASSIRWLGATRVGLLHVMAADSFITFDLLDGGRRLGEPTYLRAGSGALRLLPIPASNVVLAPRARLGFSGTGVSPRDSSFSNKWPLADTLRSCGLDAFTGRVLWVRGPFPEELALVYMPEVDVLLAGDGKRPGVQAIDPASGRTLWQVEAEAWRVHARAGCVDVVGEESRLLDARTGQVVLKYRLPVRQRGDLAFLSSPDRIVVRADKAILGYQLPAPPATTLNAATVERDSTVEASWKWDAPARLGSDCFEESQVPLPGNLVMIRSASGSYLLEGTSGRKLWQGGDRSLQVTVSPGYKGVAVLGSSRLGLVDLASGAAQMWSTSKVCREVGGSARSLRWLDDDRVFLCCEEKRARMTGMCVIRKSRPEELWQTGAVFPPPALFRQTSDEKVLATLRVVGTVGAAASTFAIYPAVLSATSLAGLQSSLAVLDQIRMASGALVAVSNLASRSAESRARLRPHDQVADWPFVDDQVGLALPATEPRFQRDEAALAWRRYQVWPGGSPLVGQGSRFSITGEGDHYRIVEQDFLARAQRTLAVYRHRNVNGMGLLPPYPIAVSLEDDERAAAILWIGGGAPASASPDLLPPGSARPKDAPPH